MSSDWEIYPNSNAYQKGEILSTGIRIRQIGMLLLDEDHATPVYEGRFQDLTVLVMSTGQSLEMDILCNFLS